MNDQCKTCIHNNVCGYKKLYEDGAKLYEKVRTESANYPWLVCKIECVHYTGRPIIKEIG